MHWTFEDRVGNQIPDVSANDKLEISNCRFDLSGPPQSKLADFDGDIFAPADLDLDGRTEWYLLPNHCWGHTGGVIDAFDWSLMTVDPSQCTDAGWPEPGVHYEPQSAVGACE